MSVPDELRRYVPRTDLYDSYELISYHMPVEQPPATASYIIFKKGNKTYAKNGTYGHIEYENTDAATVVQYAAGQLPNGGRILIKAGTYQITSRIKLTSDIILEGEGMSTILQADSNLNGDYCMIGDIAIPDGTTRTYRIAIRNMKLVFPSGVHTSTAIWYRLVDDGLIENVYVEGFNNRDEPLPPAPRGGAIDLGSESRRCTVLNCIAVNCNSSEGDFHAAGYNCNIINCISKDSDWDAIIGARRGGIIKGNTIINAGNYGIYIESENSEYLVVVAGNRIVGTGSHGIGTSTTYPPVGALIIGNTIEEAYYDGIRVQSGANKTVVAYNTVKNCNQANTTTGGIRIADSNYCIVIGNQCFDDQTTKTQTYGFIETGTSNHNLITDNDFEGNKTYAIQQIVGANTAVKRNLGYITENSGTATIPNGETSVTVAHGLAGTPTVVVLGATHSEVVDAVWSADATNITITVPSAVTADRQISWYAIYKP